MVMEAEVLVIGPRAILEQYDVLDYSSDHYIGVPEDREVLGTAAVAYSSSQSKRLAGICGVEAYDFGNHRVQAPVELALEDTELIGDSEIYHTIRALIDEGVQVWFRLNA